MQEGATIPGSEEQEKILGLLEFKCLEEKYCGTVTQTWEEGGLLLELASLNGLIRLI